MNEYEVVIVMCWIILNLHWYCSGLIGRSWSMLYASVGYSVVIYDVIPEQVQTALTDIEDQLHTLKNEKLLRGTLSAEDQLKLISGAL